MQLGCVARVSDAAARARRANPRLRSKPFELGQVDFLTTTTHVYLSPSSAQYRRLFIYHASPHGKQDTRGILALFELEGTNVTRQEDAIRRGLHPRRACPSPR